MARHVKVVGLGGSLARTSHSLESLRLALQGAEEAGAVVELFDVASLDLPLYAPGIAEVPLAAQRFAEAVYAADGMLWSSPLYHGTISGAFKNALDWLELLGNRTPAYLTDKVIGLISTSGGGQGLQAVNTMEYVVRALRGWAVPLVVPVAQAWKTFDRDGHITDLKVEVQLLALGREVTRVARQFSLSPPTLVEVQQMEKEIEGY